MSSAESTPESPPEYVEPPPDRRTWSDIPAMCAYAAEWHRNEWMVHGPGSSVEFHVMHSEVETVHACMRDNHPGVPYTITYPRVGALL